MTSTKVLRADRDFEPEFTPQHVACHVWLTPMTDSWYRMYRYRHRSELAVKKNPWYRDVDSVKVSAEGEREWNELGSKDTAIGS